MKIVLASTSIYRKMQLDALGLQYTAHAPICDEDAYKKIIKNPKKLCQKLAFEKAKSLINQHPDDIIIGADQLVAIGNEVLGKPGTRENAIKMLTKLSGKKHELVTCVCVAYKQKVYSAKVVAKIRMRKLTKEEIISYVYRDNPIDCAGSYKLEKSGLSLVQKISVSDPSSLTGLPIIALIDLLKKTKRPIPFK